MKKIAGAKKEKDYESNEELWISYYLDELLTAGFILEWKYQPQAYQLFDGFKYPWVEKLSTKTKFKNATLLQGHEYTPDFLIKWSPAANDLFFNTIDDGINLRESNFIAHCGNNLSIIDVKPQFDMQNMTRLFTINQKWMMDKFGLYVQKIIPVKETKQYHKIGNKNKKVYSHSTWSGIFPKTFTPERYFLTDVSMKPRKINYKAIGLNEYLKIKKET